MCVGFAEPQSILGKGYFVITRVTRRSRVAGRMIGTARKLRAHVVNDTTVSVNKGNVERIVAELGSCRPFVEGGLCHPEAISAVGIGRDEFTKTHQAFPCRRRRRKRARGAGNKVIRGFDVESNE